MLIISRQSKIRKRQRRRFGGGNVNLISGLQKFIGWTIKRAAEKIPVQKVVDAAVSGGVQKGTELAKKGAELAAKRAVKRIFENTKKPADKTKQSKRIDTLNELINGSGIIYE